MHIMILITRIRAAMVFGIADIVIEMMELI